MGLEAGFQRDFATAGGDFQIPVEKQIAQQPDVQAGETGQQALQPLRRNHDAPSAAIAASRKCGIVLR